jgi:DHA1 family bicyclomycin/chloramphenicol resistance-like MFS transporter
MSAGIRKDPTRGWGFALLGSFAAISPLCTDIYTPSLPDVASDLTTGASAVQLTLTAFMFGLAFGQLVIGSMSDALGRRRLLLAGSAIAVLATVACALAPNVSVLVVARVVQGFAGAAGVVLSRAIIADCTVGARTGKLLGVLQAIVGVAPVAAPLIGSLLAQAFTWRGVFWTVAAILTALTVLAAIRIPETLPVPDRHPVGFRSTLSNIGSVLSRRGFVAYLLTFIAAFGAFFSYVSAGSFVLRVQHGFTAVGFGAWYAVGAGVMTLSALAASRWSGRIPFDRMIAFGVGGVLLSSAAIFASTWFGTPLWLLLPACAVLTMSMGQIMSNCAAQALSYTRDLSGSGSAVLGAGQFLMAALVAPLVGLGGDLDPHPFGIVVLICAVVSCGAFWFLARRTPDAAVT